MDALVSFLRLLNMPSSTLPSHSSTFPKNHRLFNTDITKTGNEPSELNDSDDLNWHMTLYFENCDLPKTMTLACELIKKCWLNHLVVSLAQSVDLSGEIVGALRARLQWLRQVALSCRQVGAHLWHRGPAVSRQQQDTKPGQAGGLTNCATSYTWATSYSYQNKYF